MEEIFAEKIMEVTGTEDKSYILQNNELFYDIGYKVMQNQENANLIRCHRLKFNGMIKFVYFTREYRTLEDFLVTSDTEMRLTVIENLMKAMIQIENFGFINLAYIDNRLSHMFVEPALNDIKLIYLPVNIIGVHKNKNEFENEIKAQIVQLLERMDGGDTQVRQLVYILEDSSLKLNDISARLLQGKDTRTLQSQEKNPHGIGMQQKNLEKITLLSANGQLRFDVDTTEFLIGKSRERVQGVISGNNAISRVHCKIIKRDNSYYIVDMGSSNGTFVDGRKINSDTPELIHDGSRIRLANEDFIVRG